MSTPTPQCRQCGCTDNDCRQCIERIGEPCHWVAPDLCSACDGAPEVNPFNDKYYFGHWCGAANATDKIQKAREFTEQQCHLALQMDLSRTVRTAVEVRLRKLQKTNHGS